MMIKTLFFAIHLIWINSKEHRIGIFLKTLNSTIKGVALFFTPFYLGLFINALKENDIYSAKKYFIIFISFSILMVLILFIYRRFFERLHYDIPYNVLHYYFLELYKQSYLWHINNSTGYISSSVKRISESIRKLIFNLWHYYIPDIISLTLFIIYSLSLSWQLSLYFFISISFLLAITRLTYKKRIRYLNNQSKAFSRFYKVFLDFLYNIKTLKKLFIRDYAEKIVKKEKKNLSIISSQVFSYNSYQWFLVDFGALTIFILPIGYYFNQLIEVGQGIDVIIVIFSIMGIFQSFLGRFLNFMLNIAQNQADFNLLKEKMSGFKEDTERGLIYPKDWKKFFLKNTYYSYINNNNFYEHKVDSLIINKGEKIAVIGKSGGGKSTLLNLITRNIQPQKGKIFIDNINLNNISTKFLADNITYISQDVELFDMSLKDNILLGKKISDGDFENLINGVCLNELIKRLNGNINIMIGEKGIRVSTGERQRINIARGLIFKRDILVLDEITANLDQKTAKKIWSYIFSVYKDKTVIAVSHEKELLNFVDKKIIFENGKIVNN